MSDADALAGGVPGLLPDRTEPPTLAPEAPVPEAPVPEAPPASEEKVMTLVDHLGELRTRLVRSVLAIAIGSVVGFYFAKPVRDFLIEPLPTGFLQVLGPGDAFVIYLKISIVIGIGLAMPILLYQLWAFVSPGLTRSERRVLGPLVVLALFFFALGLAIAYLILPFATGFLLSFTDDILRAQIAAGPYFDFVTTMFLAFGLIMEFPIVLVGLSRVGVITSARLRASRRIAILGIAIFAAAATPGGDLVSPFVLGSTMYVLFELTTIYIRRSGR
jgi:sec-independent protein translocase protein TatC